MLLNLAENSSLLVLMGTHLSHLLKESTRVQNSEADMVMDNSDVVGAIGGTVGVVSRAAEVASGRGTGGVGSTGSSPCSGYGGTGGATMGGAPVCVE